MGISAVLLVAFLQGCSGGGGFKPLPPPMPPKPLLPPPNSPPPSQPPYSPGPAPPTLAPPNTPDRPPATGPVTGALPPGPVTPGFTGSASAAATRTGLDLGPELDWADWWILNGFEYLHPLPGSPVTPQGDVLSDGAAVQARAEFDRRAAIDLLSRALRDPDDRVRGAAALSAGRLGDAAIAPALRAAFHDRNPGVRRHVIAGLALVAQEEYTPLLLRMGQGEPIEDLGAFSLEDRDLAFLALGIAARRGSSDRFAVPLRAFLERASSNDLRLLGASAAASLGLVGDAGSLERLSEIACDRKSDPALRARALWSLGASGDASQHAVVLECLRDSNVDVRRAAALALGSLGEPEVSVAALRTVLESDGDVAARAFSLLALGEIATPAAKREVLLRLVRGKQLLRPWAALGAGLLARRTGDPDIGGVLARALGEERNRNTRAAIALAIGLSRTVEGREGVRRLVLEGENTRERVFASLAVALGADEGGRDVLRRAMREIPNPLVRATSALALSVFRDADDAEALVAVYEACEDPDALAPAALALAWNGSRRTVEKLRHDIDSSPRAERRAVAIVALGLGLAPERVPSSVAATARWNFLASQEAAHVAAQLWL